MARARKRLVNPVRDVPAGPQPRLACMRAQARGEEEVGQLVQRRAPGREARLRAIEHGGFNPPVGQRPGQGGRVEQLRTADADPELPRLAMRQHLVVDEALVSRGVHDLHGHRIRHRHQLLQADRLDLQALPDRRRVMDGGVVSDQPHAQRVQHGGERVGGRRESQDAHDAAAQFAPKPDVGMAVPDQGRPDAATVEQQQGGQQVLGIRADVGGAGLDHADLAVTAGLEVGIVRAGVHPRHSPQQRRKIQELARDGSFSRNDECLGFVDRLAKGSGVLGEFGPALDAMARLEPCERLWHQPFEQ
jgi:hypothetical protein